MSRRTSRAVEREGVVEGDRRVHVGRAGPDGAAGRPGRRPAAADGAATPDPPRPADERRRPSSSPMPVRSRMISGSRISSVCRPTRNAFGSHRHRPFLVACCCVEASTWRPSRSGRPRRRGRRRRSRRAVDRPRGGRRACLDLGLDRSRWVWMFRLIERAPRAGSARRTAAGRRRSATIRTISGARPAISCQPTGRIAAGP